MSPSPSAPVTGADVAGLLGLGALAGVLLSPLRHYRGPQQRVDRAKAEQDAFPLSTFPMFSEDRRGRIVVPHVVGERADGTRVMPHHSLYGAGGLNQVRRQIARDIRRGRAGAVAQRYADALSARGEQEIRTVRVVRARYLFEDWFHGRREPQAEALFAHCPVGGTAVDHHDTRLPRCTKETA